MAPLSFQNTTFANKTVHNVYLCFPPAPPLEISPGRDILSFSAQVEEIYTLDPATQKQNHYSLETSLSLDPGSVINVVGDNNDFFLQYSNADGQVAEMVQLLKASRHDQIDLDLGTLPFKSNTLISHVFEAADKEGGSSLSKPVYVGSRGGGGEDLSAISHHLLQTFLHEDNGEAVGTRSADVHVHIPAATHFNTMPYNDAANQYFYQQTIEAHAELQNVRSMLMLLASEALADFEKQRGRPISPTQETALHNKIVGDAYFKAPFSPRLNGLLLINAQGNKKIDITCHRNEVHQHFIKCLAPGLGVDETAYDQLDSLLTNTIRQLASGNFNANDNINFVLTFTSIPREKIPGSDYETIVPKLTVLYIQSSVRIFSEIVKQKKSSSTVGKVNLKFEYNIMTCTLNRNQFKPQQTRFDQVSLQVCGQSLSAISSRGNTLTVQVSYN